MNRVLEGTHSPAAYTAMCRGAKVRIDIYRLADEEMEQIRTEEDQAAADDITAQQNQYRIQALIDQDLVACEKRQNENQAAEYGLTDKGRKCFGYRFSTTWTQENLDELRDSLANKTYEEGDLNYLREELESDRIAMEAALADLKLDPEPPRDPLTGQCLKHPPAGVRTGLPPSYRPAAAELSPETLQDYIRQADKLCLEIEKLEDDPYYDVKLSRFLASQNPESRNTT